MWLAALTLAPPCLAAFALLRRCWAGPAPDHFAALCLQGAIALGLGLGASSCSFFVWHALIGPPDQLFWFVELSGYSVIGLLLLTWRRGAGAQAPRDLEQRCAAYSSWHFLLPVLFVGALAVEAAEFASLTKLQPHGVGDAWFTWNMRARFLHLGGEHWTNAFSNHLGEGVGDYPLLVPAAIARLWYAWGESAAAGPAAVAALFTFALAVLLASAVGLLRGPASGGAAGLMLLATPFFVQLGASQVADIPLSFYILSTLALVALFDVDRRRRGLVLAGMTAGFAAWTKNEGILFLAAAATARTAVVWWRRGWRSWLEEAPSFLLGAAPIVAVLVFFKLSYAPEANYLLAGQDWEGTLGRLTDPSRYVRIAAILAWRLADIDGVLLLLLVMFLLLVGGRPAASQGPSAVFPFLTVAVVFVGYVLVYAATPLDLTTHLLSSLHRLLMHLLPALLFSFFLFTATPEEAIADDAHGENAKA